MVTKYEFVMICLKLYIVLEYCPLNVITDLYLIKLLDPTFVSYDELVNGGLGRDEKEGRGQIVQGGNHSVSASG